MLNNHVVFSKKVLPCFIFTKFLPRIALKNEKAIRKVFNQADSLLFFKLSNEDIDLIPTNIAFHILCDVSILVNKYTQHISLNLNSPLQIFGLVGRIKVIKVWFTP